MKQIIDKLASLERDIASEKSEFSLFALLLREDANNTWDFVASAPWLDADSRESLDYLANQLRARLDTPELLSLSMIVILEPDNPVLEAIHKTIEVRHGMAEVRDCIFSSVSVKHAYIITSARDNAIGNRSPQLA